jgi:flagellar hook-associated protein 3 FlgL
MRVTDRARAAQSLRSIQAGQNAMSALQTQVSTGKKLTKPSDAPTDVSTALQLRNKIGVLSQYSRNADDGIGWLGTADNALTTVNSQVTSVRDLVLQGMSLDAVGAGTSRLAMVSQVDTMSKSLLAAANTTYQGRPIFGGTTGGTVAFDAGGTYVGDTGQVTRTVGDSVSVRVDVPGDAFGTGSNQLFSVLTSISGHLQSGDTAGLSDDLGRLDSAADSVRTGQASAGASYRQLMDLKDAADNRVVDLGNQRSDLEDADMAESIMNLQLQSTGYQAALAATAKIQQPSLLDFLR